jgi:hypothetical protein
MLLSITCAELFTEAATLCACHSIAAANNSATVTHVTTLAVNQILARSDRSA